MLIKLLSKSLLLVLMLTSCVTTRKNISKAPEKNEPQINKIIRYATLAGNSHNTQPWKVEVENGGTVINVMPDLTRKLNVVDPTSRGLYISLGAFIENLCQAASYYGLQSHVSVIRNESSDNTFARITLKPAQTEKYDLTAMERRVTLRTPYKTDTIKTAHLEKLTAGTDGCVKIISSAKLPGQYIAAKTLEAYAIQARREDAKKELAEWIRFSNNHVKAKRDGLTTAGMGITGFGGLMVSMMYKPEDSMKDSFIEKGISNVKIQTENCGGWLLITQQEDSPESWIKTGRVYQRINLRCRDLMIGMHPMNQMIEEPAFEEDANKYLNINGKIQFVARIGYVDKYPEPVSVRREIKDFMQVK